jgi:hypothetical protein
MLLSKTKYNKTKEYLRYADTTLLIMIPFFFPQHMTPSARRRVFIPGGDNSEIIGPSWQLKDYMMTMDFYLPISIFFYCSLSSYNCRSRCLFLVPCPYQYSFTAVYPAITVEVDVYSSCTLGNRNCLHALPQRDWYRGMRFELIG